MKNNYTIEAFEDRRFFFNLFKNEQEFNKLLYDFSFEKARNFLLNIKEVKDDGRDFTKLLAILIKCGYSDRIYNELETYPKDSLILFAILDDRKFQEKISIIM